MSSLATEFQVGKATVYDIKNSKDKIITFACEAQDVSSLKNSWIVKRASDDGHDRAIHQCFFRGDIRAPQLLVF